MKSLKLLLWIVFTLFRSGILPHRLDHWWGMARAFRRCGPSFAFLGEVGAVRFSDKIALIDDLGSLTFGEIHRSSQALARFLAAVDGVRAGQKVAIVFSNHRGFVLSLLAVTRLGADVLPLDPRLPAEVLARTLARQDVDFVLHEPEVTVEYGPARVWSEDLDAGGELKRVDRPGRLVVLTSGSTGVAKGIVRRPTLAEVLPVTAGLLRDLPIRPEQPAILAIPFFHGYGIATLAMSLPLGCSLCTARRYHISTLLTRQAPHALLVTVPTLLWRWLEQSQERPEISAVITGSAPLPPDLCRRLLDRLGPILYNLYGATETGLIALATPPMLEICPGCVGVPLPGNEIRIEGKIGPIEVRGPLVLGAGADGWMNTGDLGRLDDSGYLLVCGRADGMIVSGGENVYPHELEEVLALHPEIREYSVVAVEDQEFGKRLVAAVVATAGLDEISLKEWLGDRLERHKQPRRVYFLQTLPRNDLGKVNRKELLELIE